MIPFLYIPLAIAAGLWAWNKLDGSLPWRTPEAPQKGTGRLIPPIRPPWRITQRFMAGGHHPGLDLAAPIGTPLYAPAAGTVIRVDQAGVGRGKSNGNAILLQTEEARFIFLHLSEVAVAPGEQIEAGQFLGKTGNTGLSTGPHLHLQAWNQKNELIDPLPFFDAGIV